MIRLVITVRCVIARGLIAVTLLSTLAACGNSTDQSDSPASPTSPGTSQVGSPSTSTTSSGTGVATPPSATPPPTPTTTPFPKAKDGQNYKACNDGNCEVLIRKAATFTLDGEKVKVTMVKGTLRLTHGSGYVSLSGGGYASWSDGGPFHNAALKAGEGDTAILVLVTR